MPSIRTVGQSDRVFSHRETQDAWRRIDRRTAFDQPARHGPPPRLLPLGEEARIHLIDAKPSSEVFPVYLSLSSPQAVRFLVLIRVGRGLKPSARIAGIGKETGYRFLRERYLQLHRSGSDPAAALTIVGVTSSRVASWEANVDEAAPRNPSRGPGGTLFLSRRRRARQRGLRRVS